MIRITICLVFVLMFVSFAQAQKVPKAIEAQIQKELDCDDSELSVSSVKIGSSKLGYQGYCDSSYQAYFYEKTGNGIKKIFDGTYSMNGQVGFTKKVYNGYYEILMGGSAGPYLTISETYRWNGSRYIRYKCEEENLENPKKPRRSPC